MASPISVSPSSRPSRGPSQEAESQRERYTRGGWWHLRVTECLPDQAEEGADVVDEEVGDLAGGVVAAAVVFRPVDDVLVVAFGEGSDRVEVEIELRQTGGRGRRLRRPLLIVRVLVVQPCRGPARVGEPIDADVGQDVVVVDGIAGRARRGPHPEEFGVPGELSDGRVGQGVGQRLRPRRLYLAEARHVVVEGLKEL